MSSISVKTIAYTQRQSPVVRLTIRVTLNRVMRYKKTNYQIPLKQWTGSEVAKGYPNAAAINADLDHQVATIKKELLQADEKKPLTIMAVERYLAADKSSGEYSFSKLVMDYVASQEKTQRKSAGTLRNYMKQLSIIHQYAGTDEILFPDIDKEFLTGYEQFLVARGYAKSTIWDVLSKFIGKFQRLAVETWPDYKHNPFFGYKKPPAPKESNKAYLTVAELDKIEATLPRLPQQLQMIGNYFLLSCYSGIRHSDWGKVTTERLVDNDAFKVSETTKNMEPIYLSLEKRPKLKAVLGRLEPIDFALQYVNRQLKLIGAHCGIDKMISTHVGRHTFGVLHAELGYSKEWVAQALGITTDSVEWYYKVTRRKMRDEESVRGGF